MPRLLLFWPRFCGALPLETKSDGERARLELSFLFFFGFVLDMRAEVLLYINYTLFILSVLVLETVVMKIWGF